MLDNGFEVLLALEVELFAFVLDRILAIALVA
jgi:hypothetical protein